jgi:hypothetical protein
MSECDGLLPPPRVIHERLTRNQRERRLLRNLMRLTLRAREESLESPPEACRAAHPDRQPEAARPGGMA